MTKVIEPKINTRRLNLTGSQGKMGFEVFPLQFVTHEKVMRVFF